MKKAFIILLSFFIYSVSYAQVEENSNNELSSPDTYQLSWGIKAGINMYNLYGKERDYIFADQKTSYKLGFHIGGFVDTRINEKLGLRHELILSQRKAGVHVSDSINGIYKSTLTMYFIDVVPANLTYQVSKNIQIYAGPYVSALVAANIKLKDENGNIFRDKSIYGDPSNDEKESRYLQKFDFGVNIGAQYQIKHNLAMELKYTHGFLDLFQYANSYTNEDSKNDKIKIFNRGFMASVVYSFK
ncbi:porin family protein [Chryseobacterium sp. ERMR1:04]|uniref:porin family protein n=1 Tax=Chryseobacterium sp. ERMR1:04 TaxID=1705393 RepID=UPI0006C8C04A|nr:porin family protein [Chryseobacterium sp. ERMR1:04]KPH13809.1 hypothetical protein AMQ68_09745 [Chryseobacterium sp. ERMR1:04]